jgi:hypothetical protein
LEESELRARTAVIVALVLLATFLLALPYLELLDSNDIALVGQDFEIDILNVLTVFGICVVLLLRLLAFLPSFRTNLRALIQSFHVRVLIIYREVLVLFVVPDRLSVPLCDPFPLLI